MYSIYDQINNRKVLVYPERLSVVPKQIDTVKLSNEQIASSNFLEDYVDIQSVFNKVEIGEGNFIYHGDNIEVLKTLPDNSIDSCVTDPPYGISCMGLKWDYDVPLVELWKECCRVLKPGGYLLSFGSSRTYHRMAVNVEDAGFEIRDQIMWVYGSGFPHSRDIGKDIAKLSRNKNHSWEGFGTNLKPAHEPIVMARKLFKGSVANNVLKWNTGGINIDKCRINNDFVVNENNPKINQDGRWPANIIFNEVAGKILDNQSEKLNKRGSCKNDNKNGGQNEYVGCEIVSPIESKIYNDQEGSSRFFYCPKPSTKEREEGLTNDSVSIKGRDEGQDNRNVPHKLRNTKRKNTHSTVKPLKLMQYLIRLVTPIGGITIDPFFGSGTLGKSVLREDNEYKFIGIEKEQEYFNIAVERCKYEYEQTVKVAA